MCNKRLWIIFFFSFAISTFIIYRLFILQVVETGKWQATAHGQQKVLQTTTGERGGIYLTSINGNKIPVAINSSVYYAFIEPRKIEEEKKEELIITLSEILDIEEEVLSLKLGKDNTYEVLKRNLEEQEVLALREVEDVHLRRDFVRSYPEGELAAHVVGFVGGEGVGQYGVEQYYEQELRGEEGIREGMKIFNRNFILADSTQSGEDIELTIDYNIQHFTEGELKRAVERTNAEGGLVVVGDPSTGEIIAIASYPTFDVNRYSEVDSSVMRNSALQETFEPGSVFKPITMVIALDRGVIKSDDTFQDVGVAYIRSQPIYNYNRRAYGLVTMTEVMEKSINTGMVHVKDKIGNQTFLEYLEKFKLFEPTGIDLHGEVYSLNKNVKAGYEMNFATASYGQGIELNAIQIFRSFSVFANGGRIINPFVLKKEREENEEGERIISPSSASLVTDMLVSTVERGFGSTAKVPGYHIAGKTGTAQVAWSKVGINQRGYMPGRTIQGFAGYAPAYNPEFVIFVKLDFPQTRSAEVSAAPVFREIAKYIFEYKRIPHDYDIEEDN